MLLLTVILLAVLCFGVRVLLMWKQTGKTGISISKADNAHRFIGRTLIFIAFITVVYVTLYTVDPERAFSLAPLFFSSRASTAVGYLACFFSIALCFTAQVQMRSSWRIGIDTKNAGALITSGFYKYSRNPVYLFLIVFQLGLFLVLPTAFSLMILLLSYILMQIQVRLEEEFLRARFGDEFKTYCDRVSRWLSF